MSCSIYMTISKLNQSFQNKKSGIPKVKPLAMMIGMRAIVFMRELCNVDATYRAKIVTALRSRVRVAVIVLLNQSLFFNDGTLLVNN